MKITPSSFAVVAVTVVCTGIAAAVTAAAYRRTRERKDTQDFMSRYSQFLNNTSGRSADSGSDGEGEEEAKSLVKVIFGSRRGNAEALATALTRTLRDGGVPTALIDPRVWTYLRCYTQRGGGTDGKRLFQFSSLAREEGKTEGAADGHGGRKNVLVFVVATDGEGASTSNFVPLFTAIKTVTEEYVQAKKNAPTVAPAAPFAGVYYAVFGLGDSSYKYFNRCGTELYMMLQRGGATPLQSVGFGDAGKNTTEDAFDVWQEQLFTQLREKCHYIINDPSDKVPSPFYECRLTRDTQTNKNHSAFEPYPAPPSPQLEPTELLPLGIVLQHRERLSEPRASDGSWLERYTFSTRGTAISYQAGDHLAIFPANPDTAVNRVSRLLGLTAEQLDSLVELGPASAVPGHAASGKTEIDNVYPKEAPLREVLRWYVDLCGKPKRGTLRLLARYCTDAAERHRFLRSLDARNGGDAAETHTSVAAHKSVLDYMEEYPSCCSPVLTPGRFLEALPRLQARYYSIASDPLTHRDTLQIIVRVVPGGLAGHYLSSDVAVGSGRVTAYVRASSFHLPSRLGDGRGMLLIGPGTGAAAHVGLCHRREALMRRDPSQNYGPCIFFFGAQHEAEEYYVREEVTRWALQPEEMARLDAASAGDAGVSHPPLSRSVITLLDCAFSRDSTAPDGGRLYVTHLLQRHKDAVCQLLLSKRPGSSADDDFNGIVFLCGEAGSMAKGVDSTLAQILEEVGGLTRAQAKRHLANMELCGCYLKDVY